MDDKSHLTDQMPATIGRYKIQESIGSGAMGAVYKAFDPLIKRTLAIKTIRPDIPRGSPQYRSFIERFYHEARISGTLSHPNIVTLFDIGEEGGLLYLAMEFVEGETIAQLIARGERFKPEMVIALSSQVASALDYAHGKGIIHRDVKPSNLILFESDRIKIMDFGIAKELAAEVTQSGTLLGTPSYMSPEQAMGEKLDGRSDIFSLGVVCFEMLCGEQPFPGNNVTSILYKLVHVEPIEPANLEMNGLVPQKWHEVFGKVLAKKPPDRYQTAGAFVRDLEYCLGSWFGSLEDRTGPMPGVTEATAAVSPGPAEEPTVVMSVPSAAPSFAPAVSAAAAGDASTVMIQTPPALRPSPPAADASDSATVVMKPAAAPAPPPEEAATVVLKSEAAPHPAPTPVSPQSDAEATIVLADPGMTVKAPSVAPPARPAKAGVRPEKEARTVPPAAKAPPPVPEARSPLPAGRATGRTGPSPGLLIGGAGALFAVALTVAGIVLWKNRSGPDPPPSPRPTAVVVTPSTPTPAPVIVTPTGALHVETLPAGAVVTVNGEVKGTTPVDLAGLPQGSYEVKIELKGYEPRTETVSITPEAPRAELSLPLSRAAPAMGTADILSTPFGATVSLDGSKVGVTPLTDLKLKAGSHAIEMARDGYEPWTGSLTVTPGKRGRVDALLRPKAAPSAAPVVDVVDTSRIYNNTGAEVDTLAKKSSGPSVAYPDGAPRLRSGESVSVSVSFVVTENGEVAEAKVVESGGKLLDEAVLGTVRTWKYTPATKKGTRVKVQLTLRQTFRAG